MSGSFNGRHDDDALSNRRGKRMRLAIEGYQHVNPPQVPFCAHRDRCFMSM